MRVAWNRVMESVRGEWREGGREGKTGRNYCGRDWKWGNQRSSVGKRKGRIVRMEGGRGDGGY